MTVELRELDLRSLEELATEELCQSMLINTFNAYCNNDITELDLLKFFIMIEQQSKASHIIHCRTTYGYPVLKIHIASQHIHTVYEAINTLDESQHRHHFFHSSIAASFLPTCKSCLATADDRASRVIILQAEPKRKTDNLQQATRPTRAPQPTPKNTT